MPKQPPLNRRPDIEKILNRILYMISRDVNSCEKIQNKKVPRWSQLEPDIASKLMNYARTLKGIIEIEGNQRKKAKKLTDEQLKEALLELHNQDLARDEAKSKT